MFDLISDINRLIHPPKCNNMTIIKFKIGFDKFGSIFFNHNITYTQSNPL